MVDLKLHKTVLRIRLKKHSYLHFIPAIYFKWFYHHHHHFYWLTHGHSICFMWDFFLGVSVVIIIFRNISGTTHANHPTSSGELLLSQGTLCNRKTDTRLEYGQLWAFINTALLHYALRWKSDNRECFLLTQSMFYSTSADCLLLENKTAFNLQHWTVRLQTAA